MKKNLMKYLPEAKGNKGVYDQFTKRISEGHLSRDENSESHFCVYFAAYDLQERRVFVGLHKKSGYWLFSGGHLDVGESPVVALEREIFEEWGEVWKFSEEVNPSLLTITNINNDRVPCRKHFDIWYFIQVNSNAFSPDPAKLEKEFYEIKWTNLDEAKEIVVDLATKEALEVMFSGE